ncbi:hypothetical protein MTR67_026402 [Solanum verrucosum]|uniref:Uncharacterized protein n=1 Tax=Solanum verrucosum TaxID=315347 RepID=A0AAF0R2Y0_SOLVR|nr:hypothetical protein MTR67_026402 [Solanum verrucosum]
MILRVIFVLFEAISGLHINWNKSFLYPVNEVALTSLAWILGGSIGDLPTVYLGMPLGAQNRSIDIWNGVVEKCEKRLVNWRSQYLSLGGRLTLINNVFNSMPTYMMSFSPIPDGVIERLDALRRHFLWEGNSETKKFHLVKWDALIGSKQKGVMGVRNLKTQNQCLIMKWLWRLASSELVLWKEVIQLKYEMAWTTKIATDTYGISLWRSIRNLWPKLRENCSIRTKDSWKQFSTLLENQANVTNPGERMRIQAYALRTGGLFRNIGAMLLELGRTTMTLRMGETPDDAVVNAGPAVFVSTAGPNPIMVQPLPFQPNASFGAVPVGTVQNNTGFSGGSVSSGFIPRNIDIRIRTGSFMASNPNRREPAGGSQQPGQAGQAASIGGSSDQQNTGGTRSSSARESAVRVVPIRTVVTAVPASIGRSTSDSVRNPMGIFYPVLARVQHVSSGNSNNSGASQESDQNNLHGVETRNPANPDSAGQQQNAGLPSVEEDGCTLTSFVDFL